MPLDSIVLRAAAAELNDALRGVPIDRIYQPQSYEIVIALRRNALLISAGGCAPRICLTREKKENPAVPPMFTMLLRKHLSGGTVMSVTQEGFERIVRVRISAHNDLGDRVEKSLICEIMGRNSNIILTDENDKIIDAVRRASLEVNSARAILPHFEYTLPPRGGRRDPTLGSEEILLALAHSPAGQRADEALVGALFGVSPLIAREAVYRATGGVDVRLEETDAATRAAIAAALFAIINTPGKPNVIDFGKRDFTTVRITQYENAQTQEYESVSEMLEDFYSQRERAEQLKLRSATLTRLVHTNLARVRKKKVILAETLRDAKEGDKYREWGDIISANIYKIEPRAKKIEAEDFYNGGTVTIKLDETKTGAQNAQSYYKKYNKSKSALENTAAQQKLNDGEERYLESVESALEDVASIADIGEIRSELVREGYIRPEKGAKRKKKETLLPPLRFEYEDYEIFVGRNNTQNDYLTLRLSRARDMWLHTKDIPGSHVLIKYKGEDFPPSVIEYAASLAAAHSKAKNSPRVAVDYCPIKNVRKPNGAKSGMVIYEGYNTAYVKPHLED